MAIGRQRDLFVYELGIVRELESAGEARLVAAAVRIHDPELVRFFHEEGRYTGNRANINACFDELGGAPPTLHNEVLDGIQQQWESFLALRPSPEVLDLFVVSSLLRWAHLAIASYEILIDQAAALDADRCRQLLQANLAHANDTTDRLNQLGRQLRRRFQESLASTVGSS